MYNVKESFYGVNDFDLFDMAKRVNKKRSFLFVSKVLGKHLPAKASDVLYYSMLLARRLNEVFVGSEDTFDWSMDPDCFVKDNLDSYYKNDKKLLFIGFAETATGLGQCVFDRFENSVYFQTTREIIDGVDSVLTFEEEHSHATSHYCYVNREVLNNRDTIVLVDDEVTTGNTSLNIIKDIQKKYPRDEYVVVSYLNWMSEEEKLKYAEFEKVEGIKIKFVYLLAGEIDRSYVESLKESEITDVDGRAKLDMVDIHTDVFRDIGGYIKETGRFGLSHVENQELKRLIKETTLAKNPNTLVIGDGELMYLPIMIAYYLGNASVKTTTRSPIHVESVEGYLIKDGLRFDSLDGKDIKMHLYNNVDEYKNAVIVVESVLAIDRVSNLVDNLYANGSFDQISVLRLSGEDLK